MLAVDEWARPTSLPFLPVRLLGIECGAWFPGIPVQQNPSGNGGSAGVVPIQNPIERKTTGSW